jgi:hypothetical protein
MTPTGQASSLGDYCGEAPFSYLDRHAKKINHVAQRG